MIRAAKSDEEPTLLLSLPKGTGLELVNLAAKDTDIGTGLVLKSDNSPAEVTIDGGGRMIELTGDGKGSVITVGSGVTLTLQNITFKGLDNNNAPLIKVDGGTLVLEDGAVITGNTNTESGGGGVYVCNSGTFSMKGGTISDNKSTKNEEYYGGGGVFVSIGTFSMSGGTIRGNEAMRDGGGGVFVISGTFSMSGGTISNNKVNGNFNGGGVFVDAYGATFTMSGGTISDNEAKDGGGVFVNKDGAFSMSDGTISGNKAADSGGGVFVKDQGTFIKTPADDSLTSGVIYGNTAPLLANAAKGDSFGHAVRFEGGGNNLRSTTAGENITLTTKTYGESGGWDPKTQS
jgi:hypothetical protein